MLAGIRNILKQKGQGIVEYAVLLSLIVVLAMALQSFDIKGSIMSIFDDASLAARGMTVKDRWATSGTAALLADKASSAARLKTDQESLRNIGRQFIGMKRSDVEAMLATTNTNNVLIGSFKESTDGDGTLTTEFYTQRSDGTPQTYHMYNWMEGSNSNTSYDSSRRYLYSDYAVQSASTVSTGSGIKAMNIKYDSDNRVKSIDIAVNPNSGGKDAGLWVTVKK